MNKFAERLRGLRPGKGMPREEPAERPGTLQRNIFYRGLGRRECGFDMLVGIAEAPDVSVDHLLSRIYY